MDDIGSVEALELEELIRRGATVDESMHSRTGRFMVGLLCESVECCIEGRPLGSLRALDLRFRETKVPGSRR